MGGVNDPTGVWVDATGVRTEILRVDGQWTAYTYATSDRFPDATTVFDTAAQVAEAIRRLEVTGHARQPDRVPRVPPTLRQDVARRWSSPGQLIGAAMLVVAVLVVIAVLS